MYKCSFVLPDVFSPFNGATHYSLGFDEPTESKDYMSFLRSFLLCDKNRFFQGGRRRSCRANDENVRKYLSCYVLYSYSLSSF